MCLKLLVWDSNRAVGHGVVVKAVGSYMADRDPEDTSQISLSSFSVTPTCFSSGPHTASCAEADVGYFLPLLVEGTLPFLQSLFGVS